MALRHLASGVAAVKRAGRRMQRGGMGPLNSWALASDFLS